MSRRASGCGLFMAGCLSLGPALFGCAPEVPAPKPPPAVPPPPSAPARAGQVCSEVKSPEGGALHRVVVRGGGGGDAVCRDMESQAGRPYSDDAADRDLRALFARDLYADVVVVLEDAAAGPVLAFELRPLPAIASIQFEGATVFERPALLANSGLEGRGYKASWAKRGAEHIAILYRAQAYNKIQIDVSAKEASGGAVAVTYRVSEGPRSTLRSVKLLGNTTFSEAELRAAVAAQVGQPFGAESELYTIGLLDGLYRDRGKVRAVVSRKALVEQADGAVDLTLSVEEGATFKISKVSFEGDPCIQDSGLRSKLQGLRKNIVFQPARIQADLRAIEAACKAAGKVGQAEPEVDSDIKKSTIALKIRFVPAK